MFRGTTHIPARAGALSRRNGRRRRRLLPHTWTVQRATPKRRLGPARFKKRFQPTALSLFLRRMQNLLDFFIVFIAIFK